MKRELRNPRLPIVGNAPRASRECPLEPKVAALSDPRAYPQGTLRVEAIETHLSWIFLTERHAYKLKKPQRFDHYDLGSVEARRRHCAMEIRLNRRLTDDVYLGAVTLARADDGRLRLEGEGDVVDWLIEMRRLPRELMLDQSIARGAVRDRDLLALVEVLARFYRICPPAPLRGPEFRAHFAARLAHHVSELSRFGEVLPVALVEELGERQLTFLEREGGLFDERVDRGFVVEGHGDLRPEHVCLETRPQIIDCLEFSRELRTVDCAEELGFLALECERLGAARIKGELFEAYGTISGDRPPAALVDFYQSHHALSRARLAIRHLDDPAPRDPARWPRQARDYLRLAQEHLDRCAIAPQRA
jgi:aminoglycoside phosphotransferase family enzyme